MPYTNPILPGFYPDPSVCRVGEDYYLVTSSFEYFPGVPIFHSRDLVNWKQIGHCLTRKSQLDLDGAKSSGGIYAPTIRYHDGRFYMVTTDTTGIGNFYVYADDPAGEWSDPIRVAQGGIDPSLFWDDDGTCYFKANGLWGADGRGLFLNPIDIETGKLQWQEPKWLWAGTGGKYPEAPHIYKRDGWYYLLIAEGGTEFGHMISIARSRAIDGPYESCPGNPILSHRSTANPIQSTGHGELFEDHLGRWWLAFLAVRHQGYPLVHHLGRETYLAPVTWTEDGWPLVNDGQLVELEMPTEVFPSTPKPKIKVRDDFDSDTLALTWNFLRNPAVDSWSLTQNPGQLTLACGPGSLSDTDPISFIGRRQQHFTCHAETQVEFAPGSPHEEAGLTAIMNEAYHTDLFVTQRDGHRTVVLRRHIGSLVSEVASVVLPDAVSVRLRIDAEEEWYHFSYQIEGVSSYTSLGSAETRHHSTEIAGGFTGIYFGLFATAQHQPSNNSALFDWFDYDAPGDATDRTLEPVTEKPKADA